VAFVVDDNEIYGQELADVFARDLQSDGGTILGHEHISNGDIPAQLIREIVSAKPDAVFYGGVTSNGGGHLKMQLVQAGFTNPLIGGAGIADDEQYLNDAGPTANNTYAVATGPDSSTLPQSFTQAYQHHYGVKPDQDSADSYDAAIILITAIKSLIKTNPQIMHSDIQTIRRHVLEKVRDPAEQPYQSVTGLPITFDSNGDNAAAKIFVVYAVENGQWSYKPDNTVILS
jgi:branched-chain amino acid transport system substrate-binding protein